MATGFAASASANTVGNLEIEYTSTYVGYFFRYRKIVEDFKRLRDKLEFRKERVKNDIDEAKRQAEVIEEKVQQWLTKVEKELGEVQNLADQIERSRCFRWCPSWSWRCYLSKKVAEKAFEISKLLEIGNFSQVGHRVPFGGRKMILSEDIMPSESLKYAFNGIMKALESDTVSSIGLYGMPGTGKTTLAREVRKQVRQKRLFDKVVMVTMSQTPNISKIQNKIARILGLQFEANTDERAKELQHRLIGKNKMLTDGKNKMLTNEGRAEELQPRLIGKNKMLIIVDDVSVAFKLETLGIPFGGQHDDCKVLLITRFHHVCIQMDCQKIFQLNILSMEEAWALFKDIADLKYASPTLNDVAMEVAHECYGLPLAVVVIGKALQGKSLDEWIVAKHRLKDSRPLDDQDFYKGLYSCLELSYNYLREDNIQSCFLLCSLFPEDDDISVEMLTICGIGQGLFHDIALMEERRREIRVALIRLQKFGLLLEADDECFVRMHDVVRDFAHWITSKGENKFMVKYGLEWFMSGSFGHFTAISLWNCKISNLPDKLELTKLKTLILVGEMSDRLPSTFFQGMQALLVLCLKNVELSLEALKFLTNLQTLRFELCELENISSLGNMKRLEILALLDTNIDVLPESFVQLHRLKSLYFSGAYFPPDLLTRF